MICKLSKIWRLYEEVKTLYGDYGGYIGKFRAIIGCWRFYGTKVGIELLWQLKTAELVYWGFPYEDKVVDQNEGVDQNKGGMNED